MTTERLTLLNKVIENYSEQEKARFEIGYLQRLIVKIAENKTDEDIDLMEKIDKVINNLPEKISNKKLAYGQKLASYISDLKSYTKDKYNLIPKGHYKKTFQGVGIALGPSFGLLIGSVYGKIAIGFPLGIPIGIAVGLAIGNRLDKKAEMEGRVI